MRKVNLTGQRFGRLVVLEEAGRNKFRNVLWRCRCDCGNEIVTRSTSLRNGHTSSCGCLQRERSVEACTKHGMYETSLYHVWRALLGRCGVYKGASEQERRNYIERGITVCDEWRDFANFYDWSISHGYEKGLDIDRTDNDRGYAPDNCRFVTRKQNLNNRRCTVRLPDETSLAEFCSEIGINTRENGKMSRVYHRISDAYTQRNKIHPDLFTALEKDIEKQERLLAQARSIREEWETKIALLKDRLKSASLEI